MDNRFGPSGLNPMFHVALKNDEIQNNIPYGLAICSVIDMDGPVVPSCPISSYHKENCRLFWVAMYKAYIFVGGDSPIYPCKYSMVIIVGSPTHWSCEVTRTFATKQGRAKDKHIPNKPSAVSYMKATSCNIQ